MTGAGDYMIVNYDNGKHLDCWMKETSELGEVHRMTEEEADRKVLELDQEVYVVAICIWA